MDLWERWEDLHEAMPGRVPWGEGRLQGQVPMWESGFGFERKGIISQYLMFINNRRKWGRRGHSRGRRRGRGRRIRGGLCGRI